MLRLIGALVAICLLLAGCKAQPPSEPAPSPRPASSAEPSPSPSAGPVRTSTPIPPPTPAPTLTAVATPWHVDVSEQSAALLSWAQGDLSASGPLDPDDLTQYAIELWVDIESLRIDGSQRVRYTNTEDVPLGELAFRLFPETPGYGGQMTVDDVWVDGRPTSTRLDFLDSALYVMLDEPIEPGESLTLSLDFRIVVPEGTDIGYGQFSRADGILSLPNAYPLLAVYDDEGWNVEVAPAYGDAVYSDVALYRVEVTAPLDQVVVTSGSTLKRVEPGDGTATTTSVSGPMRDFAIVMSSDFVTSTAMVDGVLVTSYTLAQDVEGGRRALGYATDALRVFGEMFGSYPYAEFDVVQTPTAAGGIEYPGMAIIAQRLYDEEGGYFEFVVVHETAHQWWYGLVGGDQVDEPWLDEALTQYSTSLYFEELAGPRVAEEVRRTAFEERYEDLVSEGRDAPVGQPVQAFSNEDYGPVVYGKGPLFFQALRDEVGDDAFAAILRAYLNRYRYGIATPEGFLSLAEDVSGQELSALYDRWILGSVP